MDKQEELDKIINDIGKIKNSKDAWYILCRISLFQEETDAKNLYKEIDNKSLLVIYEEVFKNESFNESLKKILIASRSKNKGEDEDYKIIKLFLQICFLPTAIFLEEISAYQTNKIRNHLKRLVKNIENELTTFSSENIIMCLAEIPFNKDANFNDTFPLNRLKIEKFNREDFFKNLQITDNIIVGTLSAIPYLRFVSESIRNREGHLGNRLSKLYGASEASDGKISYSLRKFENKNPNNLNFDKYINNLRSVNEKIISYIIRNIAAEIKFDPEISFEEQINQKIEKSSELKREISAYCKKNLSAFNKLINGSNEWSNKIFIKTIDLLSILEEIKDAKDLGWKRNVAVKLFNEWLNSLHEIINRNELIDDWIEIAPFTQEENNTTEWKGSFVTGLEDDENTVNKNKIKKELIPKIAKSILGMVNADGGNIIVGLIEHPEKITDDEIKAHCIKKNELTFFDIEHEFKTKKQDADSIKRLLQDKLAEETLMEISKIDKYWKISKIILVDDQNHNKKAEIYKIKVAKGESKIFSAKITDEIMTIRLVQRVNARTIYVDPRDFLKEYNENEMREHRMPITNSMKMDEKIHSEIATR